MHAILATLGVLDGAAPQVPARFVRRDGDLDIVTRSPVIFGHVLLAVTGLGFWVIHLLSGSGAAGRAAAGILAGVATLSLTMFTRWIPVHPAYVAAEAKPGRVTALDFPAERAFPMPAVAGHGLLAATTVTLVLLAMLGR